MKYALIAIAAFALCVASAAFGVSHPIPYRGGESSHVKSNNYYHGRQCADPYRVEYDAWPLCYRV
jgi:hypothetical protein